MVSGELFLKRKYGKWLAWSIAVVFLMLAAAAGYSHKLLTVVQPPEPADVIVVLGGGAETRAEKAIELYQQGYADRILVSGKSEEGLIGRIFRAAGIPQSALHYEPESCSTFENARFSLPYLQRWEAGSVLLVTSWFHSRRATAVFRSVDGMPKVVTVPAGISDIGQVLCDSKLLLQVLKEYLKIAGYWVRYGIVPIWSGVSD